MPPKQTFYLLSLGCAKNTVDSDGMGQLLGAAGFVGTGAPEAAALLIVNTCGFIEAARRESIAELRSLAAAKRPGQLLIAAGCLAQRYGSTLAETVPGLDGIIGTRRWMDIVDLVQRLGAQREPRPLYHLPAEAVSVGRDTRGAMQISVQGASAYLKIADGCRRPCAFCAIPAIKGTMVSRPPETIVREAQYLQAQGVQELVLIAQDTTDYGHDLDMQDGLATLLEMLVGAVPTLPWLRVMYAYPGYVTGRLIDVMAAHPQILPYIDIPLQHANPAVLRRMHRPAHPAAVLRTIERLRRAMPGVALRTTFIVGYPGETDAEFAELLDFVRAVEFDRVGAFTYSREAGTPSADLPGQLPEALKTARLEALMELQQGISLARNQALVGQVLDVLIEGQGDVTDTEGNPSAQVVSVGRSYRDAPEIDGMVFVEGRLALGQIVPVRIGAAMVYDLLGEVDSPGGPCESL